MTSKPMTKALGTSGIDDDMNMSVTSSVSPPPLPNPLRDKTDEYRDDSSPPVARAKVDDQSDAQTPGDDSQRIARTAWLTFRDAINATDDDSREASYLAVRSYIDELWKYAKARDIPFRDLLGMLTAATKYAEFDSFGATQLVILYEALGTLAGWMIEEDAVMKYIERFAEHDIDISGPIMTPAAKKYKISIEVVE
jgi:hypothetical protein